MTIAISGVTGFIGSAVARYLRKKGEEVIGIYRGERSGSSLSWESLKRDPSGIDGVDAIVHLAGRNIAAERWTRGVKEEIRSSRIRTTQLLAHTIQTLSRPPRVFLVASAVGYYGDCGDRILDESSPRGRGFLADLCGEWEEAAQLASPVTRVVNLRFGLVLGREGGALAKMLLPFRLGVGGKLGSGTQWWSWIALDDVVRAVEHCLRTEIAGPVNVVAPQPVTNLVFTRALGRALGRWTPVSAPGWVARAIFGEMADETFLSSTRAIPKLLEESGFSFSSAEVAETLRKLL